MKKLVVIGLLLVITATLFDLSYQFGYQQGKRDEELLLKKSTNENYREILQKAISGKNFFAGPVVMEPNSVMYNCVILSVGDGVVMEGENCTIANSTFFAISSDWTEKESYAISGSGTGYIDSNLFYFDPIEANNIWASDNMMRTR